MEMVRLSQSTGAGTAGVQDIDYLGLDNRVGVSSCGLPVRLGVVKI